MMRFVLTVMMPSLVPLHFLFGIPAFAFAAVDPSTCLAAAPPGATNCKGQMVWDDAKVVVYVVGGGLLIAYELVEVLVLQRAVALRRGLMTPYQVLCAGFANEEGFGFASAAEPYRLANVSLEDVGLLPVEVQALFTPLVLRSLPGTTTAATLETVSRPQSERKQDGAPGGASLAEEEPSPMLAPTSTAAPPSLEYEANITSAPSPTGSKPGVEVI